MRVSCYKDDPGYHQFMVARENGKTVRVYLNGDEVQKCTVADEESGFVKRCVLDTDGKFQIDPNDPEAIWEERVEGDVRIVIG
jgi:hypothetical protein